MLELPVDLVAEEPGAPLGAELDDPVEHLPRHQRAGRVVRRVDVDESCLRSQRPLERVEVVSPAICGRPSPLGHLGTGGEGDLERRLVARCLDDDVVAGLEEGVVGDEDGLLGSRDDDDVVRLRGLVHRGDRGAQLGRARRLGVAEPLGEQPLARVGLEREQVGDGHGLGVARGEHERRSELVLGVVLLDPEGRDLHGRDTTSRPAAPRPRQRRARHRGGAW